MCTNEDLIRNSAYRWSPMTAEEIGAVLVCTCTSSRLIPALACWISGELGIFQTQGSFDLVAVCAGLPYGLTAAT